MSGTRAVLILGGGLMQLPAVRAAQRLDLQVHLADGNAHCRARGMVDRFYHIDLKDMEALYRQAREIPALAGVFTAGTDFSTSVAYVAEQLGLPGIPYEVSLAATDKSRMRRVLDEAGVPVPRYLRVEGSVADATDLVERTLRYPLVIKPVDNMGARGVRRIDSPRELLSTVATAQDYSRSGTAIIEELIEGTEYSLDAIVVDGSIYVTGVGERHIFFSPYFVELGHTIPADIASEDREALEEGFRRAIRAIGITRGAAKGDVFLTRDAHDRPRAVIGEIAARLSGGFMSGWTYPYATGVDLTELGLRVALGETPDTAMYAERNGHVSVERALISAPGTVREVTIADEYHRSPPLRDLFVHCRAGDTVGPPSNNVEKIANAIATASNRDDAENAAADALDRVRAHLTVGDRDTERFLFVDGWNGRFARYGGNDIVNEVSAMPAFIRAETAGSVGAKPIPLCMINPAALQTLQIGITGPVLLRRLIDEGVVRRAEDDTFALAGLFWRPFLAAGRQGVDYLLDAIDSGRLDTLRGLLEDAEP